MAARTGKTTGTPKKGAKNASPQKPAVAASALPLTAENRTNTRSSEVKISPKNGRPLVGAAAMGAGPGRPRGVPNKATAELRDMIRQALDKAGGVKYLEWLSLKRPESFTTLLGKILPTKIEGSVALTVADLVTQAAKDDK